MNENEVHLNKNKPDCADDEIDIFEVLGIIISYRWLLIACFLLFGTAFVAFKLITYVPTYSAEALILAKDEPVDYLEVDPFTANRTSNTSSPFEVSYKAVMTSDQFLTKILQKKLDFNRLDKSKFNCTLFEYLQTEDMNSAIKKLKKIITFKMDKKSGLLTIIAETKDPFLSAWLVNELIKQANDFYKGIAKNNAKEALAFLKVRLKEVTKELDTARSNLATFLKQNKQVAFFNPQKDLIKIELFKLQKEKLESEVETKKEIYKTLITKNELLNLEVEKNISSIKVVAYATPPTQKEPRGLAKILLIGCFAGLVFGSIIAFIHYFLFVLNDGNGKKLLIDPFINDLKKLTKHK